MGFFRRKKKNAQRTDVKESSKLFKRAVSNARTEQSSSGEDDEVDVSVDTRAELSDISRLLDEVSNNPKAAPRALRQLFDLSDLKPNQCNYRVEMVAENKRLVPVLLDFLKKCEFGSSEQYLALLVLNNLSIPRPNKRIIAMEYGGASILVNMLCEDISCHLMAIILVNLSFADSDLRRDLSPVLLEGLTFVLQEACKIEETNQTHEYGEELLYAYPETAKWVCAALKNLTRPTLSGEGCKQGADLVPLLQQIVAFPSSPLSPPVSPSALEKPLELCQTRSSIQSVNSIPDAGPSLWEINSIQDAALFCLLNLAISCGPVLMGNCVPTLSSIANYDAHTSSVLDFQRLKARMALSYLVGSTTNTNDGEQAKRMLLLSNSESQMLVECLDHTLSNSAHPMGLYSASTFAVKWVLFAIRNLLPVNGALLNQQMMLNSRLLQALAEFTLNRSNAVDSNAAEYAAIALHFLSTHGLEDAFYLECENEVVVKILASYLPRATEIGRYAARQVLLRLSHLQVVRVNETTDSLHSIAELEPAKYETGASPQSNILHKPILGYDSSTKERRSYSSAMQAVQNTVRTEECDEIYMANSIANAADSRAEAYEYIWTWEQDESIVDESAGINDRSREGPVSIFGMTCGSPIFCASPQNNRS